MVGKTNASGEQEKTAASSFETISQQIRWLSLITVLFCFPNDAAVAPYVYGLVMIAAFFNLTRYVPVFMRQRWFSSPVTILVFDTLAVIVFSILIDDIRSPFNMYMAFVVIGAAYRYKLRGILSVLGVLLFTITVLMPLFNFEPVVLNTVQSSILMFSILLGLGIFSERLTQTEREEKDELTKLGGDVESGRQHLLTLVDSLQEAIFVVDDNGRIQNANAQAMALCEESDSLYGKSFVRALKLRPHVNIDHAPVSLLKKYGPQHRRDLSTFVAGAMVDLDITVKPVHLHDEQTNSHIIICRDITEERELEEQRTSFISVASHELRTPITIMEAALSTAMLSKDKMDVQTLAIIAQAHRHCMFLATLVKDLAILSEASNDNIPIEFDLINVPRLFAELNQDFEAQARQKSLTLHFVVAHGTPDVYSTESHIHEILQNYITNAIKYSESGRIEVRAEPSRKNGLIFSVSDTGIGISPSNQKHLFTKFFRAEEYQTRKYSGTGLGLYLCRELAQRLNGRVWCESEVGKGSVFFFELPSSDAAKVMDK